MFSFKVYKNKNEVLNFSSGVITTASLDSLFTYLSGNIQPETQVEFSITDTTGNTNEYIIASQADTQVRENGKVIEENNFFQLMLNKAHVVIDTNILRSRVVTPDTPNIEDLKAKIMALKLPVDPNLALKKQSQEKESLDLKTKMETGLDAEQKDKYSRLQELNSRLTAIQSQIDFYQNEKKIKEELGVKIKKLSTEKDTIAQMLQSVELLIKNRDGLVQKVNAYNGMGQNPDQIKELRTRKISYLNNKLYSNRPTSNTISEFEEEKKESKFKISINISITLAIVNIIVTLLAFLYSYSLTVLVIGVIFSVILMVLYLASRFFSDSLEGITPEVVENDLEELPKPKLTPVEPEDPNTQLFINTAWANALKNELAVLDDNIKKNLNGKSFEILKQEQMMNQDSLAKENKKIEDLSSKSITSDEYYKKRRESDILKIERENLEFGLKLDPATSEKIESLEKSIIADTVSIELSTQISQNFPIFIAGTLLPEQIMALKQNLLNQLVLVIAN